MNFKETLEVVKGSEKFKGFIEKNPSAFLCAGFFVIDLVSGADTYEIDYYISEENKIATFSLLDGKEVIFKLDDKMIYKDKKPLKISEIINIDLEKVKEVIEEILEEHKAKKLQKIIAILQHKDGNIWSLTCLLEGMGMLKLKISAENGKILEENLGSLFDIMQVKGKKENEK